MDPASLMGTKFKKLKEICTQVHLCENVQHQRQKKKKTFKSSDRKKERLSKETQD